MRSDKNHSSLSFYYVLPPQTKGCNIVTFSANEKQKKFFSQILEIKTLKSLKASFNIERKNNNEAHLSGRIQAHITQLCVISLESIHNELDFLLKRHLVKELSVPINNNEERWENLESDQDVWDGKNIDLTAIIIEELTININPYPRKKGVNMVNMNKVETNIDATQAEKKAHPFAALEQLKIKK